MAIAIGKLRYDVVADTSGLRKELDSARAEMRAVNKVLRDAELPVEKYKRKLEQLRVAEGKGKITTEQYRKAVAQLKTEFRKETAAIDMATKSQDRLNKEKKEAIGLTKQQIATGKAATAGMLNFQTVASAGAARMATAAGGIVTLGSAIRSVADEFQKVDDIVKQARKLGVATTELQALRLGGEQLAGMDFRSVDMALQRMTRRLSEAAAGTGEAQEAIKELGLSAERLNAMAPSRAFRELADAIQRVRNPADQLRLAFKLFDSEGAALVNVLKEGGSAVDVFRQKIVDAGLEIDNSMARNVEELNDKISDLKKELDGLKRTAVEALAEPLTGAARLASDELDKLKLKIDALQGAAGFIAGLPERFSFGGDEPETARRDRLDAELKEIQDRIKAEQERAEVPDAIAEAIQKQIDGAKVLGGVLSDVGEQGKNSVAEWLKEAESATLKLRIDQAKQDRAAAEIRKRIADQEAAEQETARKKREEENIDAAEEILRAAKKNLADFNKDVENRQREVRTPDRPTLGRGSVAEFEFFRDRQRKNQEQAQRERIAREAARQREKLEATVERQEQLLEQIRDKLNPAVGV